WDALMKWGALALYIEFGRPARFAPLDVIMESQIRAIEQEQPDMVIGAGTLTMSSVAYTLGLPALNIHNAYMIDFILKRPYFRYWWHLYDIFHFYLRRRRVYKRHGVKPKRAIAVYRSIPMLSPDLPGLYETCRYFHNARQIRPILFDYPAPLPEWFGELDDGTPNVYITMGSTGRFDSFLRGAFDQLARLPYRFVVTTAGQIGDGTMRSAPANFRFAKYAPGAQLLRHCSAMVFHGGNGSMYQALAEGVPMLAIPTHYEQEMNTYHAGRAGFCKRLSPRKSGSPALARAVRELVETDTYRAAAQRYAGQVRATNGAVNAADICEQVAEAGVPAGAGL
ncbi:MAG: hypothetical protein FJY92_08740, partial [Candidatus Hydrogenedentes bacterium]|nr:hypothetical protein [Candidatus Hydrogenedentota bacterium]